MDWPNYRDRRVHLIKSGVKGLIDHYNKSQYSKKLHNATWVIVEPENEAKHMKKLLRLLLVMFKWRLSLRKRPYYIQNFTSKNWKFSDEKLWHFFIFLLKNIDCEYSLELPQRGSSNEYTQSMFLSRNKKNNVYPCKLQFYYIKLGFKWVTIIKACFRDGPSFYFGEWLVDSDDQGPPVHSCSLTSAFDVYLYKSWLLWKHWQTEKS